MNEAVEIKLRLQDLIQRMPDEIATPLRELSRMLCAVIDHNEKERTRTLSARVCAVTPRRIRRMS